MSLNRPRSAGVAPAITSDFVGRERELERIASLLLGSARLITLVGSGGIGKTRLAAEAVQRFRRIRRVPVYWVRLARLAPEADTFAVEAEVAQAIVDGDFSERSSWVALVDTLRRSDAAGRKTQTILVMDNCEHVLDGAGRLIADLLDAVPGLAVIATSREAIGWVDENRLPVPALSQQQALTLFRSRAELAGNSIADGEDTKLANAICRHLHNHPLHIRLAAARLRYQPLSIILRDLTGEEWTDRRLNWPDGPRVGVDERHRGIRDVIAWSYRLCEPNERLLFRRLSVFAAGYDVSPGDEVNGSGLDVGAELEAIVAVCADDTGAADDGDRIAPGDVEGLLERLADQSLVSVHLTADTVRYSLLESFRVFAQQRLNDCGGEEWIRLTRRHRRYYRDKVSQAVTGWFSPAEYDLLVWARSAWDNLLSAIDSSLSDAGEATVGLEIAAGLIALRLPAFKGSLRELRFWTEQTLAVTRSLDPQPIKLQVSAMALIGWVSLCQGIQGDVERMLDECVASCIPDPHVRATWRQRTDRDLDLPPEVGFTWGVELLFVQCDGRSMTVLNDAGEKFTHRGDRGGAIMSELFEVMAAGFFSTASQALDIARRHLDTVRRSGALWAQSWAELAWAIALTKHGDPDEARTICRATLSNQLSMRDQWGAVWTIHIQAWSLGYMATAAQAAGDPPDSVRALALDIARLMGGAASLRKRLGVHLVSMGPFALETERAINSARAILGHEEFAAVEAESSTSLSELNEIARLALGSLSLTSPSVAHPVRRQRTSRWQDLSGAEQEVATLAAAGWTNAAIAARRGSSFKTVDAQVAAVFQKLMIRARGDIINLVPDDQRARVATEAARRPQRSPRRKPRPHRPRL